tara:strand:+ start:16104 stop:16571 length:468 start_codon:yes stop_codon:yes gene_type:complete
MSDDIELVNQFYTAFQNKDAATMASFYHPEASFEDEVFTLQGEDIGHMWTMLCARGKDMTMTFKDVISTSKNQVSCHWEPIYTFSGTGRKVHNRIDTRIELKDGKIWKQRDVFSFWSWASQALGLPGKLLGWTPLLKNKVRKTANKSLEDFKRKA